MPFAEGRQPPCLNMKISTTFFAFRLLVPSLFEAFIHAYLSPNTFSFQFFIGRLLVPFLFEAVRMVERGDAKPEVTMIVDL